MNKHHEPSGSTVSVRAGDLVAGDKVYVAGFTGAVRSVHVDDKGLAIVVFNTERGSSGQSSMEVEASVLYTVVVFNASGTVEVE